MKDFLDGTRKDIFIESDPMIYSYNFSSSFFLCFKTICIKSIQLFADEHLLFSPRSKKVLNDECCRWSSYIENAEKVVRINLHSQIESYQFQENVSKIFFQFPQSQFSSCIMNLLGNSSIDNSHCLITESVTNIERFFDNFNKLQAIFNLNIPIIYFPQPNILSDFTLK